MSEMALETKFSVEATNRKTVYVGSVAPATIYEGQHWVDISSNPPTLKIYDLTNTQWLTYHATYYETQTGAWANPSQSPINNGDMCIVYNSTQAGVRLYAYANSQWNNLSTAESPVEPTYTIDTDDQTATWVLDVAGLYYLDPDGTVNMEVQHSTQGWLGTADISDLPVVLSDGTNVRGDFGAGTVNWLFIRSIPAGVSQAEGSLAAGANHVLPAGLILLAADSVDCLVQVNDGGWVTTGSEANETQLVVSDGTNMRLYNNGAGTVYYAYVYEVTS